MALTVTTGSADNLAPTSADLNGTIDDFGNVNSELDVWFVYGTNYDSTNDVITDGSNTTKETLVVSEENVPVNIIHTIDSLNADTQYYFRIKAEGA